MKIASVRRIKIACGVVVLLPLLRLAPVIYALLKNPEYAKVHCIYYNEDVGAENTTALDYVDTANYSYCAPLTCGIDLIADMLPGFKLADIIIFTATIGISWLVILISHMFILAMIFNRYLKRSVSQKHQSQLDSKLLKSSINVLGIASSFALSNFPFTYAWITRMSNNFHYKRHYYFTLLTFLSLFFHPCFFCLRTKNIRELVTGLKEMVNKSMSSAITRFLGTFLQPFFAQNEEKLCMFKEHGFKFKRDFKDDFGIFLSVNVY
jgi:hypothetical protein